MGVVPSLLGTPRHHEVMVGRPGQAQYVGDDARSKQGILSLSRPIQNGLVHDFDGCEKLLHHLYYKELRMEPEEYHVVFAQKNDTPRENRVKLLEILFETFKVPGALLRSEALMSLYSEGSTDGLVVEMGHGNFSAACVYDGIVMSQTVTRAEDWMRLSGQAQTEDFTKAYNAGNYGPKLQSFSEREIAGIMKEELCFVAPNKREGLDSSSVTSYELPDGQSIKLPKTLLTGVPEQLVTGYQPLSWRVSRTILAGHTDEHCLLHKLPKDVLKAIVRHAGDANVVRLITDSLTKSGDLFEDMICNVILSGGASMTFGIADRIRRELTSRFGNLTKVKALPGPKYAVWRGASMLACMPNLAQLCISADEWREMGPEILNTKCEY